MDARTATEEAQCPAEQRGRAAGASWMARSPRCARRRSRIRRAKKQRIKASVEDEKKKILAAAEQEIAAATMQAQKQLQQYAAELAIEQAARKLVVSAETDRLLVQSFAQRLTGDESKKGQN